MSRAYRYAAGTDTLESLDLPNFPPVGQHWVLRREQASVVTTGCYVKWGAAGNFEAAATDSNAAGIAHRLVPGSTNTRFLIADHRPDAFVRNGRGVAENRSGPADSPQRHRQVEVGTRRHALWSPKRCPPSFQHDAPLTGSSRARDRHISVAGLRGPTRNALPEGHAKHFNDMKLAIKKAEFMSINLENISTGKSSASPTAAPVTVI